MANKIDWYLLVGCSIFAHACERLCHRDNFSLARVCSWLRGMGLLGVHFCFLQTLELSMGWIFLVLPVVVLLGWSAENDISTESKYFSEAIPDDARCVFRDALTPQRIRTIRSLFVVLPYSITWIILSFYWHWKDGDALLIPVMNAFLLLFTVIAELLLHVFLSVVPSK